MFCAKAAIFTLYLRIFKPERWLRYACWFGIALSLLIYLSNIPVFAVFAFPHGDEKWDLSLAAKASKTNIHGIITASYNVASDIYILILPIPMILRLNLSPHKKLGIFAVFGTAAM